MGFFNKMFGGKGAKSAAESRGSDFLNALSMQLRGELEGAREAYRALAQRFSDDNLVAFFAATADSGLGRVAEAAESLRALSKRISDAGQNISQEITLDLTALLENDPAVSRPRAADLVTEFGDRLKEEGFLRESAVAFEIASALVPENARVLHKFGDTLHDLRVYDYAEQVLQQALRHGPNHWGALYTYAVLLQDLGRFDEAISFYERAVRLNPEHARCRNNFGAALLATGRLDAALEQCNAAARLDPDAPLVKVNLGNVYLQLKQYQEARVCFEKAVSLAENLAPGHFGLGAAEEGLGSPVEKVRDLYLKAIELDPGIPEFRHALGNLLADHGNPQALAHFSTAAQLNPNLGGLQRDFGSACLKLGMREEALEHLKQALDQDPDDEAAREMLARAEQG